MAPVPPGIHLLVSFNREQWYRALTFMLTFLLYTSFHLSRKPISIVKSELHKNCSAASELAAAGGAVAGSGGQEASFPSLHTEMECSWKPFDKSNYKQLLGAMDYSFLCAYAIGMYLSGIIGERLPIRLYLTVGMLSSGLFTCLFGLGYIYNIHSLGFYIFVQVANGLVQTTGWPSVVTCIGNWFGKGRRGLVMGLWNSHTSVGNILGSLIAGYWVSSNWGLSFIVPGLIIAAMGVICFLFLIEHPNDLKGIYTQNPSPGNSVSAKSWNGANGHPKVYLQYKDNKKQNYDTELLLPRDAVCVPAQPVVVVKSESEPSAISFMGALRIPGVVEFSLCLLFAKLVSYTFLFWLPLYITKAAHLDAKKAGDLSTLFDVGGIVALWLLYDQPAGIGTNRRNAAHMWRSGERTICSHNNCCVSRSGNTQKPERQCQGFVHSHSHHRWDRICRCSSRPPTGRRVVCRWLESGLLHANDCRLPCFAAFITAGDQGAVLIQVPPCLCYRVEGALSTMIALLPHTPLSETHTLTTRLSMDRRAAQPIPGKHVRPKCTRFTLEKSWKLKMNQAQQQHTSRFMYTQLICIFPHISLENTAESCLTILLFLTSVAHREV